MSSRSIPAKVPILLNGATVTRTFRDAAFDAANRRGISANELALRALGAHLRASGREIGGIFEAGDVDALLGDLRIGDDR